MVFQRCCMNVCGGVSFSWLDYMSRSRSGGMHSLYTYILVYSIETSSLNNTKTILRCDRSRVSWQQHMTLRPSPTSRCASSVKLMRVSGDLLKYFTRLRSLPRPVKPQRHLASGDYHRLCTSCACTKNQNRHI